MSEESSKSYAWKQVRTPKLYAENMRDVAPFQVELRQGDPFEDLPVRIELTCGTASLEVGKQTLEVGSLRVFVRLHLEAASIRSGSATRLQRPGLRRTSSNPIPVIGTLEQRQQPVWDRRLPYRTASFPVKWE